MSISYHILLSPHLLPLHLILLLYSLFCLIYLIYILLLSHFYISSNLSFSLSVFLSSSPISSNFLHSYPRSLCILKTCRQERLQREYFIAVQLSSPLYIRDRVYMVKPPLSFFYLPEPLVFSLHKCLYVSLVLGFCLYGSKPISLLLSISIETVSCYLALLPSLSFFFLNSTCLSLSVIH